MDDDARRKRKPIVKLLDAANLDLDAAVSAADRSVPWPGKQR